MNFRFCAFIHLYKCRFPSKLLKRAFWNACCAPFPIAHHRAMKSIQTMSKSAYEQLKKLDPKCWTKAYFGTTCSADNVENNMSECFNAWIINERYLPLLNMLQEIHHKIMNRMRDKRDMQKSELLVCPRIKKKLDQNVTNSREWQASWDGEMKFVVSFYLVKSCFYLCICEKISYESMFNIF